MKLHITSTLVLTLIPLLVFLTFRVISYRRKNKISLSTTKDSQILTRVRAHGNFLEYTPIFISICLLCELQNANTSINGLIAALFVFGRYFHAIGIIYKSFVLRPIGMVLTILPLIAGSILLASTVIS